MLTRLRAWSASQGHESLAQRMAGAAFLIRVASAGCIYLSQIVFARWIGSFEFGVYVYVWTWVVLLGALVDFGIASVAQRFIPQYTRQKAFDLLRGYVSGSRWLVLASASGAALFAAIAIRSQEAWMNPHEIVPLYLACATLPAIALSAIFDAIARSHNWVVLGLLPPFVLRPLIFIALLPAAQYFGFSPDATTAMIIAAVASWTATAVQAVCLDWRLKRAVSAGPKQYELKSWFQAALPILVVGGFYNLLSYVDILLLQLFRSPEEVAHYYAAAKTLALVAFIYFSVAAAVAHRFSEYHAARDRVRLAEFVAASIRWTFWPSLAALMLMLALGRPFLWLFGAAFVDAYPLMFVMAVGLLARAAIGPGERLLSMLGEQRACAAVYAAALALNLVLCLILIPGLGGLGAAIATATALVGESAFLFVVVKYRLGIHAFIWQGQNAQRSPSIAPASAIGVSLEAHETGA